jgi:hypothetical protein
LPRNPDYRVPAHILKLREEHSARQAELFEMFRPLWGGHNRATTATADPPKRPALGSFHLESQHGRAAIHEAGHVACGLAKRAKVLSAHICLDGSGATNFGHLPPSENLNISLAGWAAQRLFGIGYSNDGAAEDLRQAGISYDSHPDDVERLVNAIADNLGIRKHFIRALAERLYAACPGPVLENEINALWTAHCR